mgnify:CR=1 FL=1
MKVTLFIPFANGDAVRGFNYEGEELTAKKYVKMEEKEYYVPETGFSFKYKIQNSDPVKFFIDPSINGEQVTVEKFKEAVTNYYNSKK